MEIAAFEMKTPSTELTIEFIQEVLGKFEMRIKNKLEEKLGRMEQDFEDTKAASKKI